MSILLTFWKYNILSAMEYRISFLMQIIFMVINDLFFLFIWYMFFQKFPVIRGMNFQDFIPLLSIFVCIFAFMHVFFNGWGKVAFNIANGGLDNYLLLPGNPLLRILTSSMDVSAIGDFFYGIGILFLLPHFSFILVLKVLFFSSL